MVLKVHPGIGFARVGNSAEYFIGPETVDVPPTPAGGYRDTEGLMRRQAARFRVFDGTTATAGTSVTWTVTLQGGTQSISGAGQVAFIVVGSDTVAELQTDADGNLLVLSCQINSAGTNGCCDGPVQASVMVGSTPTPATTAWVTILPPDFAPGVYPKFPYQVRILDYLVEEGVLSPPGAATSLSFRRDIYPVIRGMTSLSGPALLALPDAAARAMAVPFYTAPIWEEAQEGDYLHALIERFHAGTFVDDWATATPLTPDELDRGPLTFVDTSCPGNGWELGNFPLVPGSNPIASGERFRFGPGATPGLSAPFYNWVSDVGPCLDMWISIAKSPNLLAFGADWRIRGFMVQSGGALVYQDWVPKVTLLTPALDFGLVQRGSMVGRTIDVELKNFYEPAPIEFVTPLPEHIEVLTTLTSTGQAAEMYPPTMHLVVLFRAEVGAALGSIPPDSIELHIDGEPYFVPITAEIVEAESTQIALVLDCSSSMTEDRGDGQPKLKGLKDAVHLLADIAREGDGIAIAPFNGNPLPTHTAEAFGPDPTDPKRQHVRDFVDDLDAQGSTSIGDGLESARDLLPMTTDPFEHEALIVVTDGKQTAPKYIEDVMGTIQSDTFAIGIGTSANVDAETLETLTGEHEGYLLLTGETDAGDNHYVLEKYFLQLLAGATQETVIVDPTGSVLPGAVASVEIAVTEAEFRLDVIVVSDDARELVCALVGPDGEVRTFDELAAEPVAQIVRRARVQMARLPVPFVQRDGRSWSGGTWHLLLAQRSDLPIAGSTEGRVSLTAPRTHARKPQAGRGGKPITYAAVVNARSAIDLKAHAVWREKDAKISLEASVALAGAPLVMAPSVIAAVKGPSGVSFDVPLKPAEPGR